jgi:hypothetical protein
MKLSNLLYSIGIVVICFWLLGVIFKVTYFLAHMALFIGVIFIIVALLQQYANAKGRK